MIDAQKTFWIGESTVRDSNPYRIKNPMAFRRNFALNNDCHKGTLMITAAHKYGLWINGKPVGYGPARAFPEWIEYDTYDVTPWLQPGENAIAVVVSPSTGSTGYASTTRLGLLLQLEVETEQGTILIGTDRSWNVCTAAWYGFGENALSESLDFQEHFSQLSEPENWMQEPQNWANAFVLGPVGTPPWKHIRPRSIPFLQENPVAPPCIWVGQMTTDLTDPQKNLALLFEDLPAVQRKDANLTGTAYSTEIANLYVFDFGRTRYIRPGIRLNNFTGNGRIELYYGLHMGQTRPTVYRGFLQDYEGFVDTFTPRQGDSEWTAFFPKGFRFLAVRVAGECRCTFSLSCKTVDYPFGKETITDWQDPFLKKLWQISTNTIRSATTDVYVDTCSRENVLWTFDSLCTARAAYATFGELTMWKRCVRLIAEGVDPDGIPKTVVPSGDGFMKLFDQNFYWVQSCLDYYSVSHDKELLHYVAPAIERFLTCCREYITEDDLFIPPLYAWHWVDWAYIDKRPYSLPINALLLMAAEAAVKIGEILGRDSLICVGDHLRTRIRPACQAFYDEQEQAFLSHIEPAVPKVYNDFNSSPEEKEVTHCIHANALAYLTGIGTPEQRHHAVEHVVKQLAQPLGRENTFGPGWIYMLLMPVYREGYNKDARDFLEKLFTPLIEKGLPTWAEGHTEGAYNTAHGWGSILNCVIREMILKK